MGRRGVAKGAVPECALVPFLSEDFTKVVKGWRPSVGAADAGFRGFGEPPVFWVLDVVKVPVPKGGKNTSEAEFSDNDRCEVDAVDFVFRQPKGAVCSQKTQKRMARQKRAEVVWSGPAVVREQRAANRVPIGHRGATMRKALFEDSDEGSSDCSSDGRVGATEGGCSRLDKAARNRLWVIRRDKAEVGRKVEREAKAARLAAAVEVQSTGGRYADKSRGFLIAFFLMHLSELEPALRDEALCTTVGSTIQSRHQSCEVGADYWCGHGCGVGEVQALRQRVR